MKCSTFRLEGRACEESEKNKNKKCSSSSNNGKIILGIFTQSVFFVPTRRWAHRTVVS